MNDGFSYALDAAVQHFSRDEAAKPVEPWQMTPDQLRSFDADGDSPLHQYARWHTTAQRFGEPGSQVPVFRSVSDGDESNAINPGNWVSANEDYAKNYGGKNSRIGIHEFSRSDHGCRANLIAAIHSCLNQDGKHKPDESVDTQIPEDPAQLDPHVTQVLQALAGQDPDVKEALGEYLASCAG